VVRSRLYGLLLTEIGAADWRLPLPGPATRLTRASTATASTPTPAAIPPASVLADLTGISISTAERWCQWAKRDWAGYVVQRAADNADGVDSRKPAKQTLQTC